MKSQKANSGLDWCQFDVTLLALSTWQEIHGVSYTAAELVNQTMPDPGAFSSAESFRSAYWQAEVWSKFPFEIGIDRTKVAYTSFFEAEERCAVTNGALVDVFSRPIPERYRNWLRTAASLMEHLFSGFVLDEVLPHCKWGPGASTSMRRTNASPSNKWAVAAHITERALPYKLAFEQWSGRVFAPPEFVAGNKVTTVPKNAKTDRVIAIEPDWNMFFQLGFGGMIRTRLRRRFGLLRKDAQEVNQILAREGSKKGDLATIDLKSASDSVSLALVEALVPQSVLPHLLALRSPQGVVDGKQVTYEKISSMGNGYTFELETAIFYCLVRAASGHAVVYGDDIIVTATSYDSVVGFLSFCGFTVNEKKSFASGPFRESCGGHFYNGVNVTPPYVRKPLVADARLTFCNRVLELCDNGTWTDELYRPLWHVVSNRIPRTFYGPVGVEGVLHVPFDRALPSYSRTIQQFTGKRLICDYPMVEGPMFGALIQSLWVSPAEVGWRETWAQKGLRPRRRIGKWVGNWCERSPFPSDLLSTPSQ